MTKGLFILLGLVLLNPLPARAALDELMKNYRGIRSLGMGGVVTTTGLYDEALFGNPAMQLEDDTWKLDIINLTLEANSNVIKDVNTVKNINNKGGSDLLTAIAHIAGRNEHTRFTLLPGLYIPHFFNQDTSFAIGLLVNTQANIVLHSDVSVDSQSIIDAGPAVSVAHRFMDGKLNVGLNLRALYRLSAVKTLNAIDFLAGNSLRPSDIGGQGAGIDGDLGAYYKIPLELPIVKLSAGASINNVLQSKYNSFLTSAIKSVSASPPPNSRTLNLGVRADLPNAFILSGNMLAVEMQDIGNTTNNATFWKKSHIGAETKLIRFLAFRLGFNQTYFAAGLGLNLPLFKFDIATYGEEIGTNIGQLQDRRYALRFAFAL